MKLYLANGMYVGTQAEARKLDRDFKQVEVPTDKEGLIGYLNLLATGRAFVAEKVAEFDDAIINGNPDIEPQAFIGLEPRYVVDEASNFSQEMFDSARRYDATRSINIEDEIAAADFPTAVRLAEHATSRVGEHLKQIAEAHLPKPAARYAKSVEELLS